MEKPADTRYPIHELLARRWSPRAFDPRPLEPAQLRSVLEAARWAPSSRNEQPWYFLVAVRQRSEEFERMLGCLTERNRMWARNSGALMLTVVRNTFARNERPNRVALHDLGQAAAHLTVQATAMGLAVHQMAGVDLDRVRQVYGVPEGFAPQTAIAIGPPGAMENRDESFRESERAPRHRKEQEEFVYAGAWAKAADW